MPMWPSAKAIAVPNRTELRSVTNPPPWRATDLVYAGTLADLISPLLPEYSNDPIGQLLLAFSSFPRFPALDAIRYTLLLGAVERVLVPCR